MRHLLPVVNVFGLLAVVFGFTMSIPLAVSLSQDDGAAGVYVISMVSTLVGGGLLALLTVRHRRELHARDAFLLVSSAWTGLPAFATLP
ncbi:MAG: TrkH family potassium uptake protein, partial [Gammaproteobacteria bacterium]